MWWDYLEDCSVLIKMMKTDTAKSYMTLGGSFVLNAVTDM